LPQHLESAWIRFDCIRFGLWTTVLGRL